MKNIVLILLVVLFSSCSPKNKQPIDAVMEIKSESLGTLTFIDQSLSYSSIFKDFEIIALETNDKSLLQRINRIYKNEDGIFIFDKRLNKICVFDNSGKYISHIQSVGEGPREYISVMDFCLDVTQKQIVVICDRPYKIMRFAYDGNFISENKIEDFYEAIVMDSTFMYCNRTDVNKTELDNYEITKLDRDANQINNMLETRDGITNTNYSGGKFLTRNKNIYYTRRFDYTVYQINEDKVSEKYTIDFGKYKLPNPLIDEESSEIFNNECRSNDYIYNMTDFVENDNFLTFKTNRCICVYDKKEKILKGYKQISNQDLGLSSNSYFSNGNDQNSIITTLEPAILHMAKESSVNNKMFNDLVNRVKEDDNPILVVYKFKE